MLNDVHVPDNIPLGGVFSFIDDFAPDHVILAGDILDMSAFSHWLEESPGKRAKMPDPRGMYEDACKGFFTPLGAALPAASRVTWILGNHEAWALRAIDADPKGRGYWEPWENIDGIDNWVEQHGMVNLGKLHFCHGDILQGSSKTAADRMLNLYRRSVRFGHFHNLAEASYTSPVDLEDRHTARCCGTLQKFQPGYMRHRPCAWIHAFTYGYVEPSGKFWDHTVRITDGVFYAEGRRYK